MLIKHNINYKCEIIWHRLPLSDFSAFKCKNSDFTLRNLQETLKLMTSGLLLLIPNKMTPVYSTISRGITVPGITESNINPIDFMLVLNDFKI